MLTKASIKKDTNATTYSRGLSIYNSDKIEQFKVEEGDKINYISAKVKGSNHRTYDVYIEYHIEEDMLGYTSCECPAYEGYNGLCKHCVGALLEYIEYIDRQEAINGFYVRQQMSLDMMEGMKGMKGIRAKAVPAPQTTPAMKQLLSNHILERTLLINQASVYGQVRLEPLLTASDNELNIQFKIGVKHMYILKDVFTFVEALENHSNVYYGKKLQFVHSMDAFDIESRPMVRYISNWVQRNKDKYTRYSYSYYYTYEASLPKTRKLDLSGVDLGELIKALDTLGRGIVLADINGTGEKEWYISQEELPREMTISKKNDGIQVKINKLSGYRGDMENIYFHDGKIYRVDNKKLEPIRGFLEGMIDIPDRMVYFQKEDIPAFCRELLPVLEQHFTCKKVDFNEEDYVIPVSFEIYLDAPQKDFITCKAMAIYGENKYNIYNKTDDTHSRDMLKEVEVANIISFYCNAYDEAEQLMVVGEDEEKIYELLVNGIPRMHEIAEVFITDALKRLKIISSPKVAVGVSVAGDIMELKMTSDDMSKEELFEILTKYNRKKKFYRLKNGDFVNVAGEEIESLLELKQGLQLTDTQLKQSGIIIPKYRALYLDSEFKERQSLTVSKDRGFKSLIRNMKTIEDNDYDIPKSLEEILREYQKRGYLWIKTLKYNGFGGILADDMGLGKTLQVICFLLSESLEAKSEDNTRTLIVCPSSLVYNWHSEFDKFAPQLPTTMVIGTSAERQELIHNAGNKDILITSYDLLKRDIEHYDKMAFGCEIIDEAQYIKNSNTQAAKSVKMVKAGFKLALTGTPIENRLSELWSIFDYLMSGYLYSYKKFREEFELPIVQNQEEVAVKRLQKMITPFVLRRLKKDVLTDLPDKLEESMYASLEGEQQKLYDAHVKKLQILLGKQSDDEFKNSKIQILSELTKLRQICCDPSLLYDDYHATSAKTEMCMDLITNAISGGHKILLFSQFTSMLDRLQQRFQQEKIEYYSLTGATSKEKRAKMVEQFNKDEVPVFCISLKAGGTGLNLTAADIVIHYDPWWNLAVQNQATDRAHRIGQKKIVNVYKLIVKGTIEENIMKIQDMKKELAEQVLNGEGMKVGAFSKDELLALL